MSDNIDFKALWNKQDASDIPNTKELFAKAERLKIKTRNCLIGLNLALLATVALITYIGFNIDNAQLTTKVGIILIVIAMLSYLTAYNQIIPLLFKTSFDNSSQEYLNQLIRIKRKQDFLNKVMINIYFTLLSIGMFLYLLQFAMIMTTIGAVAAYIITFSWIAFSWFYLRPRGIRKKQKPLNDMIVKLEEVNRQFKDL